jgi:hypothetical protein
MKDACYKNFAPLSGTFRKSVHRDEPHPRKSFYQVMHASIGLIFNPVFFSTTKYRSNIVYLTVIQPEVIVHHTENFIHSSIINTPKTEKKSRYLLGSGFS